MMNIITPAPTTPSGGSSTASQPTAPQPAVVETGIRNQDVNLSYPEDIKAKILHLLAIYPIISPSMMQIGIGSSMPAKMWRPCLNSLMREGKVKQDVFVHLSTTGRQQSYTLISLQATPIAFPA